ncbi:MAG TPA: hypothetical protein VFH63_03610 [candidate division Zixibacteria bacterium]|nr:hypothetical protein [candidate division Zixibacteria bacterium]
MLLLAGSFSIPMPGLLAAQGLLVPIALLAPLALSTVLAYGLTAGDELLEAVSSRPIAILDTILVYGMTVLMLVVGFALEAGGLTELGAAAGRNSCGYVGLMLLGRRVVGGQAASLFPAGFALGVAAFGGDASGNPRWWAWLLADASDPRSWLLALTLFAVAAVLRTRGRGIQLST